MIFMKRLKQFFSIKNISNFFINNVAIIVILLILSSLLALMNINGFKIKYNQLQTESPSSILIQDRIPVLADFYLRERIEAKIVLAQEEELEPDEVLEDIEFEARYNQNMLFSYLFLETGSPVPTREKHLFTHYSLTPGGEPINPGLRITEPVTIYANWTPMLSRQPWQSIARIALQGEYARKTYAPLRYQYVVANRTDESSTSVELNDLVGYTRPEGNNVSVRVSGKESKAIVDFSFNFNNDTRKTITYDLNGGKLIAVTQPTFYSVPINGNINEFPNASYESKRFVGWSYTPTGEVIALADVSVKEDMTLYAIYEDAIPKPTDNTKGRYMSTYYIEAPNPGSQLIALKQIDNIGTIGEQIDIVPLELDHFERAFFGDFIKEEKIFAGQFLIVPKKDKSVRLNNVVISFTEFNWLGALMLVVLFGTLFWVFIDNSSRKYKYLAWTGLLLVSAMLLFLLPKFINFSLYFQNLWDISKATDPAGTNIVLLGGVIMAGVFMIIAAVFTLLTFVISIINDKLEHKSPVLEVNSDVEEK